MYHNRYHVTAVGPMKRFKIDGEIQLCFEKGHCNTKQHFKDLPLHYKTCNISSEDIPFQGMTYMYL